jgi:type III restriction enzyme
MEAAEWSGFDEFAVLHHRIRDLVSCRCLLVGARFGSETRKYLPDFIVLVDDGHGPEDLLHLIVEIKGYRREDAKEKKSTMDTYWVPGVNQLKTHERWAFAEFTEVYQIESDFAAKVGEEFNKLIESATAVSTVQEK